MKVTFANEKQVQEWYASMRAKGLEPKQVERSSTGTRFLARPIGIGFQFGGDETFREIGRIALNFLAHHRPDLARTEELRRFKEYVLGTRVDRSVWYGFAWPDRDQLPPNPFNFGHRILIGLSQEAGVAYARVSLFSTFDLAVSFGRLPLSETATIIVDIDPEADHPPDDIRVEQIERRALALVTTEPTAEDRVRVFKERLAELLRRIEDHHWKQTSAELLGPLNALRDIPATERAHAAVDLLLPYRQGILNLMTGVIEEIKPRLLANPATEAFAKVFDHFVEEDASDASGLSMQARCALEIVTAKLADFLVKQMEKAPLSDDGLRVVLKGTRGQAIAIEVMSDFVKNAFGGA